MEKKSAEKEIVFEFFQLILRKFSHSFFLNVTTRRADSKYVLILMNRWKLKKNRRGGLIFSSQFPSI
jgi:hypothetical protein